MSAGYGSRILVRVGLVFLVLAAVLALGQPARAGGIVYVVPGGAGMGDGSSWANAKDLAAALSAAASGDELWVKTGTYKPTTGSDRMATFTLKNGVAVYGGFAGTETARDQRNWRTNVTTLSGDLNGDDGVNFANNGDNVYHVVTATSVGATTILDGFTISSGNANGGLCPGTGCGGGMYNTGSSPTLTNLTFSGNSAGYSGGLYNNGSSPTVTNVTFSGNSAIIGGAMNNEGSSSPVLTNVTFSGNSATVGGAMYNLSSSPTIRNSILWGDSASYGPEIYNNVGSTPRISYSIVQGSGGSAGWQSGFGTDDGGNKDVAPLFVDAAHGNLRLQYASPAINAGNNSVSAPSLPTTDLDGNPRIAGGTVDMGAYESPCPAQGSIIYVNGSASGSNNGTSWANAYTTLTAALAGVPTTPANACAEIWVAQGTYTPTTGLADPRAATFQLKSNVAVYGGFTSGQSSLTDRNANPATNGTTLSGDIGVAGDASDNSYHVVTGSGTNNTTILDGFTISGGNATAGSGCPGQCGGGMYNSNGSPTLANLVFSSNSADIEGGGMSSGGNPTLTNITFSGNHSGGFGGGMRILQGNPMLTGVVFSGNTSSNSGGGLMIRSSAPTLTNVTFSGNSSGSSGGGLFLIFASPKLINVVFSGNRAHYGGGMYSGDACNPTLTNVTFSGNSIRYNGGGMYIENTSRTTIRNSIAWGNSGGQIVDAPSADPINTVVTYSDVQGGYPGTGNIDADPKFVSPITASAPTTTGDLHLQPGSPAINAGDNSVTSPSLPATDLDGNPRIVGSRVDMGAYEFHTCPTGTGGRLYVNASVSSGLGDGSSWANAFPTLWAAMAQVDICPNTVTEIWVAQGTYTPTVGTDRNATFQLRNNLAIYGGFAGTEQQLSERNWTTNVTTLSGDIGTAGDASDNSYHVVTAVGTQAAPIDGTAILDGFTISGGNANGASPEDSGGGMYNIYSSPTLTNVTFSGNSATNGGGMYNSNSSPTLTNVIFSGNSAAWGGGMANSNSSPTLTNVTFSGNSATNGGGMLNQNGSPTLTNVTFSGNSASSGGGMLNWQGSPTLTNVTFSGNSASDSGGGMFNVSGSPKIRNSILWGDTASTGPEISGPATVSYSIVQGGYAGTGNINADPLFATPVPAAPSTGGDLRLRAASPAINAGDNNVSSPSLPATDLDGNPRIAGGRVDMGAYEYILCPSDTPARLYVNASVSGGTGTGNSWADASPTLSFALARAAACSTPKVTEIWVAQGTYTPTAGTDRAATFQLSNNLAIYGGFAGTETSLGDRNWQTNVTTLSGDIGTANDAGDNSLHVVTGSGTNNTAVLDGFTITGGNASIGSCPGTSCDGGGMYNNGGSPTLTNVTFSRNSARVIGGGMYNNGGSATLTNVTFSGNSALLGGGGMANDGGSPTLTGVVFSGNSAPYGGGMLNQNGSATLTGVVFSGNSASSGGGMYNDSSSTTLTNVTFSGNSASDSGGGMYNLYGSTTLTGVTFSGNSARANKGGAMYNYGSSPKIRNSILWGDSGGEISNNNGSTPAISTSIIYGSGGSGAGWQSSFGTDNGGNLDANPRFVTPITASAPTTTGDLRLQAVSPAINAGDNNVSNPGLPATDLDGNPRIAGSRVDMGAYEFHTCPSGSGVRLYVNASVSGGLGDGSSWANAFPTLWAALAQADICSNVAEIWVAQGTYTPTVGTDRTATFQLRNNLAVYGGFAGGETSLGDRNWQTHVTTLSGDLKGNDTADTSTRNDNSFHVVTGSGTNNTAVLDGFTISGGNSPNNGGGMLNDNGSPTLTNVTFSGNSALLGGGGMYNRYSSPTLTNVTFSGNSASSGGGMYNFSSSPTLTNVTFSGNSAPYGGGMYNLFSSPTLTNVTFSGNSAQNNGGGMYNDNGGATLTNVTFSGNSASSGGGMYNDYGAPKIRNSILWGDSGGEISNNNNSTPAISTSIVQGSGGSGAGWQSGFGTDNGGNIDADPLFVTPITASAPTTTGDLRLKAGSPAINAGDNNVTTPSLPATDLDGNPRIAGSRVDMGAYEFHTCPTGSGARLYVNANVSGGLGDGSSWADAFPTLRAALAQADICSNVAEIWVAAGTYTPTVGTDRTATFTLRNNLAVYGGFAGTEQQLSDRNWQTHVTTLSGDIGTAGDASDNSIHVVTGSNTNNTAILDGFTVTGGNSPYNGGGMLNDNGSPTLTNLVFSGNSAYAGGGMANSNHSSPTLTGVTFSGNSVAFFGGGMYNQSSSPTLTNVVFSGNSSTNDGGAMFNNGGSPTLTNVTFSGNSAQNGGGMDNDGSSPKLTNVVFSGNSATDSGGGMANFSSSPTLTGVTFSGNSAPANKGGAMANFGGSPKIRNSILWGDSGGEISNNNGSTPAISTSIVQGSGGSGAGWQSSFGTDGGGNKDVDPLFVSPITASAPTTSGDLRLQMNSPAINAGDNSVIPNGVTTDLDGNPRIAYGTVDMGAYEAQVAVTKFSVVAPPSATQGSPFSVTVTAQDPNGVTVSAYRGTVKFSSTDAAGLPSDYTFTATDAGVHTFTSAVTLNTLGSQSVTATDTANSAISGSASVTVVRPTTTVSSITRASSSPTNASSVAWTVTFANAVNGLTASNFALAVTGLGGSPAISTVTPSGSAPATTWTVTASTGTGDGSLGLNLVNDTNLTFSVTNAPAVGEVYTIDRTAPTTTITNKPSNPSNTVSPTFTFNATDQGGSGVASVQCSLDNAAFAPCASSTSQSYSNLSDGSHTFAVKATDTAGNTETPGPSYTWVVDTTPPDTSITAQPANPTNSASASFSFSGSDTGGSGVARFECKLDGAAFAACTSPQSYSALADGSHTFQVRAVDAAGNTDPTPAGYTWVVDTVAPTISITTPANGATYAVGQAVTISYTCTDPGGSGVKTCVGTGANGSPLDTATTGPKSFTVNATDNAGNTAAVTVSYLVSYTVTYVSPTLGPPNVNLLYPMGAGPWTTTVKWTMTTSAGTPITGAGIVADVRYTSMVCGGSVPPWSDSYPVAGGFSSSNPAYDALQNAWLFNWQLPSTRGCYAVLIKLTNGLVIPVLYRIEPVPPSVLGDVNGDGKADLVWRNTAIGQNSAWLMNGGSVIGYPALPTVSDGAWKPVAMGDVNADGKTDLVWRNTATGQNVAWLLDGAAVTSYAWLPTIADPNWTVVAAGDLNGDRKADLVWRNTSTGQTVAWLMDGGNVTSYAFLPTVTDTTWKLVAAGDLNGDGKTDLVWRNTANGQNVAWLMDGATVTSYAFLPTVADPNWKVAGIGDFNNDGKADLVWRNTATGDNYLWLMNGGTPTSYSPLPTVADQTWKLVAVADLDGNGKADLVWRNVSTGQNIAWLMDGASVTSYIWLPTVTDLNWRVISPTSLMGVLNGLLPAPTSVGAAKADANAPMASDASKDAKPMWSEAAKDAKPFWSDAAAKDARRMWSDAPKDAKPFWSAPDPAAKFPIEK